MSDNGRLLIYGAYGYTGELIARRCVNRGLRPLLGGRDERRLRALAQDLSLAALPCALDDRAALEHGLRDVDVVLHCAGPFSATAAPMLEAALASGTHYLDITGELEVFQQAMALARRAREANVVLCPGAGFDVVPTDCLAATLARALPQATHLALAFDSRSPLSPGTSKTALEGMAGGGRACVDGRIVPVPLASTTRRIDFGDGEKLTMSIGWGDLVTAPASTGIGNVEVYVPISSHALRRLRRAAWFQPLLRVPGVVPVLKAFVGARIQGPSAAVREDTPTRLWGEARDQHTGASRVARLTTPNGYELTVDAAVTIAEHLLSTTAQGGYYTPSMLMGADFVCRLPGVSAIALEGEDSSEA